MLSIKLKERTLLSKAYLREIDAWDHGRVLVPPSEHQRTGSIAVFPPAACPDAAITGSRFPHFPQTLAYPNPNLSCTHSCSSDSLKHNSFLLVQAKQIYT